MVSVFDHLLIRRLHLGAPFFRRKNRLHADAKLERYPAIKAKSCRTLTRMCALQKSNKLFIYDYRGCLLISSLEDDPLISLLKRCLNMTNEILGRCDFERFLGRSGFQAVLSWGWCFRRLAIADCWYRILPAGGWRLNAIDCIDAQSSYRESLARLSDSPAGGIAGPCNTLGKVSNCSPAFACL